jgi:hypothetical protein
VRDLKPYLDPSGLIQYSDKPLQPARDLLAECSLYLVREDSKSWGIRKGSPSGHLLGLFGGLEGWMRALEAYPDAVLVEQELETQNKKGVPA